MPVAGLPDAARVLTGARQVGRSTLLRRAEPFVGWRYHTMDDFDTLRQVRENPASLWAGAHEVVLDEVQKAPELLPAIKRTVDEHPGRCRFLLSGSANLLLMGNVSESLAGRAAYLAGLTVGLWASEAEIVALSRPQVRYEPAMADARRNRLYAGWKAAVNRVLLVDPFTNQGELSVT